MCKTITEVEQTEWLRRERLLKNTAGRAEELVCKIAGLCAKIKGARPNDQYKREREKLPGNCYFNVTAEYICDIELSLKKINEHIRYLAE